MRTLAWLLVPAVMMGPAVLLAQVDVPYERIRDANKEQ